MRAQYSNDKAAIRERLDRWVRAIRAMDLEGAMSIYSPQIVSFDVEPPLQHVGLAAKRKNWASAFAAYLPPRAYQMHDLSITVGDDVAFAYSLNRIGGTLKNGNRTDLWVRWAACLRKIDGDWLIVHDHLSVPFDPASGRARLDLSP